MAAARFRLLLIAGVSTLIGAGRAMADEQTPLPNADAGAPPLSAATTASTTKSDKPISGFEFVAVPIPVSNPALGNGLALAAIGFYKVNGSERPWTTGAAGFYSDSKSWLAAVFQKAYIDDDRFRVTAGGGVGDIKIDFFGIGQEANRRHRSIPIDDKLGGGVLEGLMRVSPHFFAGLEYRYARIDTSLNFSEIPFPDLKIPNAQLESTTSQLGLAAEYDTRNSEFQPTQGLYVTGTLMRAAKALGGSDDFTRTEVAANHYQPLWGGVLATRASLCWAGDDAPYYNLCAFGSNNDLRGYVSGQYLDHAMYAVQAEYRRPLFWRLGAVAFAGFGATGASFGRMSTADILPSVGVGLRLAAAKAYGVNVRLDYALGKDNQAFYFSVGEAF